METMVPAMNRAAEAAVPEAKALLVDAVKKGYVTQKAFDGLYFMIAEQEKAFRQNPVGATSDIVKKVFSALK